METWVKLILFVTLINIFGFILIKHLAKTDDSIIITCYLSLFSSVFAIILLFYKYYENKISIIPINIAGILLLSTWHFITYIALINAVDYASNPGFVRAFVALEISILAVLYSIYYKEYMSMYKCIGLISIVFGIIIITCYE